MQAPLRKKCSRGCSHMLGQNLIDDGVHGFCGSFSGHVCLFYFVCLLADGFCNYKSLKDDVDVLGRDGFSVLLQEFLIFTYGVPRRFRYLSSSDHGDFYLWHNHIWKDPGEKGDEVNFVGGQASYLKHAQWFSEVCHCRSDIICLQKKPSSFVHLRMI